jgi:hypothetical protein
VKEKNERKEKKKERKGKPGMSIRRKKDQTR